MYITHLKEEITSIFPKASDVWIAVALISDYGLNKIKTFNGNIHILVGIDLPTPPNVLRELLSMSNESKVFFKLYANEEFFYHPKFYLIKIEEKYQAYIGSGNFTKGGLGNNIEIFLKTENQNECKSLLNWFNIYYKQGIVIDEPYISQYEETVFNPYKIAEKNFRKNLSNLILKQEPDNNQFFRLEHFMAFYGEKPRLNNAVAKQERKNVQLKLKELHQKIYPLFSSYGISLYPHHRDANIVSSYYHNPYASKELSGMWLYYGKSPDELTNVKNNGGNDSHIDNIRLQVIVLHDYIGIWCTIGKDNGSRLDREHLQEKLLNHQNRLHFFNLLKLLNQDYFIDVANEEEIKIRDISDEKQLYELIAKDRVNLDKYFIIGLNIIPNDIRISEDNIQAFVLNEFKKLLPIYDFIKFPF